MFSEHSLLSLFLLPTRITIKVNKTTRFLLVLCRGQAWSTILQDERRMKVLDNRGVRKPVGPQGYEVNRTIGGKICDWCTLFIVGASKSRIRKARHVKERQEMHIMFRWGNLKET